MAAMLISRVGLIKLPLARLLPLLIASPLIAYYTIIAAFQSL
jgi:hypothetical protein